MKTILFTLIFWVLAVCLQAQIEVSSFQKIESTVSGERVYGAWMQYIHAAEWLAVDNHGNSYVAMTSGGTNVDIDGGPATQIVPDGISNDMIIASYGADGHVRWGFSTQGPDFEAPVGLAIDAQQHIWVSGVFENKIDLDPGPDSTIFTVGDFDRDIFIAEYDTNGIFIRAMQIVVKNGSNGAGPPYNMEFDSQGNLWIAGRYSSILDLNPGPGVDTLPMTGNTNSYVAKYSPTMQLLDYWALSYSARIDLMEMQLDSLDNVYICGNFAAAFDFDLGPSTYIIGSGNGQWGFIAKYDSQMNLQWAKPSGYGARLDHITITDDGLITAGRISGTSNFILNNGDTVVVDPGNITFDFDFFIVMYDDTGGIRWVKHLPEVATTMYGTVNQLRYKKNDNTFYISMTYTENVNIDYNYTNTILANPGGCTAFGLVQYTADSGRYLHSYSFPPCTASSNDFDIIGSRLYMAGEFTGTINLNFGSGINTPLSTNNATAVYVTTYCHVPENVLFIPNQDTIEVCPYSPFSIIGTGAERYEWFDSSSAGNMLSSNDTLQLTTSTHSFSVYAEGINDNCHTSRKQIYILVKPQIDITEDSIVRCYGDTLRLHYNGIADVYNSIHINLFSSPQPVFQSEWIKLEAVNSDLQCSISDSTNLTINPLPNVTLNVVPNVVCILDEPVLSGGIPVGGTFMGFAVTNNIFYPWMAGYGDEEVTYEFTDSNNCTNNAADTVFVDNCLSINESNAGHNFKIAPNPFRDEIRIVSNVSGLINYSIVNIIGEEILSDSFEGHQVEIKTIQLSKGIYFLRIYGQNEYEIRQIEKY